MLTPFDHYAAIEKNEGRAAANEARRAAGLPVDERNDVVITMNPGLPPPPRSETVAEILRLLADPAAPKARIEQFAAMSATARDAVAQVEKLQKDAAAARDELAGLRKEMAAERIAHDAREAMLVDREKKVGDLHAATAADLERVLAHKADMTRFVAELDKLAVT